MPARKPTKLDSTKPTLVHIGKHYVAPDNVAGFKRVRDGLYILQLRNSPEPEYPLWVDEDDMLEALSHFNIIGGE